jgi:hypothetical protein
MKKLLLHLILCMALVLPQATRARGAAETGAYDKTIENYVQFLKQQKQTPVDYIRSLFQTYDLVVLCERSHPEVTQYDMIYELAADKRFQQQAGHIFMENGTPHPTACRRGVFDGRHLDRAAGTGETAPYLQGLQLGWCLEQDQHIQLLQEDSRPQPVFAEGNRAISDRPHLRLRGQGDVPEIRIRPEDPAVADRTAVRAFTPPRGRTMDDRG